MIHARKINAIVDKKMKELRAEMEPLNVFAFAVLTAELQQNDDGDGTLIGITSVIHSPPKGRKNERAVKEFEIELQKVSKKYFAQLLGADITDLH